MNRDEKRQQLEETATNPLLAPRFREQAERSLSEMRDVVQDQDDDGDTDRANNHYESVKGMFADLD